MKMLLILRHAKSSWKDSSLADHDRPLNRRGEVDAPRMGEWARRHDLLPELILASTARRARQTVTGFIDGSGYVGDVRYTRDLYAAGPEAYLEVLAAAPDGIERVMVVGHNPGLEELLTDLTGEDERLPTAALAQVDLDLDSWSEVIDGAEGKLAGLWRPKEL